MVRGQPGAGKTTLAFQFLQTRLEPSSSRPSRRTSFEATPPRTGISLDLDLGPSPGRGRATSDTPSSTPPTSSSGRSSAGSPRPWTGSSRPGSPSTASPNSASSAATRSATAASSCPSRTACSARGITTLFLGESARQELDIEVASIVQGVVSLNLSAKGTRGDGPALHRGREVPRQLLSARASIPSGSTPGAAWWSTRA